MEEKTLKFAAASLLVLMIGVCIALPYFPDIHTRVEEAREARVAEEEFAASQVEMNDND